MTFEIPEDGIPLYNESFPGGLAHFYGGVKGYIYTCRGDFQTDENTTGTPWYPGSRCGWRRRR